jgi:hypothetical protein
MDGMALQSISARDRLLNMVDEPDPFDHSEEELLALRIEAANELFQTQREQIIVLERRAQETGITEIRRLEDIVPLLFAHTVYKSYQRSFLTAKRWDRMLAWLNTLSTRDPRGIDMTGVETVDDWLNRLKAHGHGILASSGSTGKNSFLDSSPEDRERKYKALRFAFSWPGPLADKSRKVFWAGPAEGFNGSVEIAQMVGEMWARPGEFHSLKSGPLLLAEANDLAVFSQRLADGDATPDEIAAFNARAQEKARAGRELMAAFTDELLASRHEPIVLGGFWAQVLYTIERARELGIPDGDWNQAARIHVGGGVKNVKLPDDYKEQVDRFFGKVERPNGYAMTELAQMLPRCEAHRYHIPPGLIVLPLDETGERLVDTKESIVAARFGFLDLVYEGRWGGIISGDRTEIDYAPRCACGRRGPTILDTITRFSQTGDDKITCAGTIDSYVSGALAT